MLVLSQVTPNRKIGRIVPLPSQQCEMATESLSWNCQNTVSLWEGHPHDLFSLPKGKSISKKNMNRKSTRSHPYFTWWALFCQMYVSKVITHVIFIQGWVLYIFSMQKNVGGEVRFFFPQQKQFLNQHFGLLDSIWI